MDERNEVVDLWNKWTFYLRDLLVPVAESVELWELRAFMVPINRPLCKYQKIYHFPLFSF